MPLFDYHAMDAKGKLVTGQIDAATHDEAVSLVRKKGLFPTSMRPVGGPVSSASVDLEGDPGATMRGGKPITEEEPPPAGSKGKGKGKSKGKGKPKPPEPEPSPKGKPTPPPAPSGRPGAPAVPAAPAVTAEGAGVRSRLAKLKMSPFKVGAGALALGGLGALLARNLRTPPDYSNVNEAVSRAVNQAQGQQVAKLLEQARLEKSIAQNQARIAQANPTLYTSVMAGRRVPTGAVVLGGRPRMDLMRELAASMDSGAFQKRDPLSDLMG